jgi:hypothetical protein
MANGLIARLLGRHPFDKWWMRVLLIWAATRALTTVLFLALAQTQGPNYWTGAKPGYFEFLNIWDAEWFERIYRDGFSGPEGYLSTLPIGGFGEVTQNSWAFMPGFPFLIRLLNFGAGWQFAAPTVSLLLGFGLALVSYQIFFQRYNENTSLWAVAWLGLSAPALIFQAGYADTLGLFLLASVLLLVLRQRYLWATLPVLALSVTRPGVVALALALGLLWLVRFWRQYRRIEDFDLKVRVRLGILAIFSFICGWLWSIVAWIVTGRPDAYLASELSWRTGYMDSSRLIPFEGWSAAPAYFWGKPWGSYLMLALIAAAVALLFSRSVRSIGLELWLWVVSYYAYLLAVFFPQSSTFRILLMVFPLFGAFAFFMRRFAPWVRWVTVLVSIVLQWWWLWECWRYVSPDFSPP